MTKINADRTLYRFETWLYDEIHREGPPYNCQLKWAYKCLQKIKKEEKIV